MVLAAGVDLTLPRDLNEPSQMTFGTYLAARRCLTSGIERLPPDRCRHTLALREKIGAAFNFVHDVIAFGWNEADKQLASCGLADWSSQCNSQGPLFVALLGTAGIPNRFTASRSSRCCNGLPSPARLTDWHLRRSSTAGSKYVPGPATLAAKRDTRRGQPTQIAASLTEATRFNRFGAVAPNHLGPGSTGSDSAPLPRRTVPSAPSALSMTPMPTIARIASTWGPGSAARQRRTIAAEHQRVAHPNRPFRTSFASGHAPARAWPTL